MNDRERDVVLNLLIRERNRIRRSKAKDWRPSTKTMAIVELQAISDKLSVDTVPAKDIAVVARRLGLRVDEATTEAAKHNDGTGIFWEGAKEAYARSALMVSSLLPHEAEVEA